jgi:hypothetical protein
MVFRVEMDGESISCSSAQCVDSLLRRGWQLSDPSQRERLERELAAGEECAEAPHGSLRALAAQD